MEPLFIYFQGIFFTYNSHFLRHFVNTSVNNSEIDLSEQLSDARFDARVTHFYEIC